MYKVHTYRDIDYASAFHILKHWRSTKAAMYHWCTNQASHSFFQPRHRQIRECNYQISRELVSSWSSTKHHGDGRVSCLTPPQSTDCLTLPLNDSLKACPAWYHGNAAINRGRKGPSGSLRFANTATLFFAPAVCLDYCRRWSSQSRRFIFPATSWLKKLEVD